MTSPELSIVSDDNTATAGRVAIPAQAGVVISTGGRDDEVERAFEAAVRDQRRLGDLLDALSRGRLWLPLADDGRPAIVGSAVRLPTVRYLGDLLVPAYTSAARLNRAAQDRAAQDRAAQDRAAQDRAAQDRAAHDRPEQDRPAGERPGTVPHAVVAAAGLCRLLPAGLGIALNPGGAASVPVYPAGVAYLAAEHATVGGRRVSAGPPAVPVPGELLASVGASLAGVRAAREAAAGWLMVQRGGDGDGLVISVRLDDPADAEARDAVVAAVQRAVAAAGQAVGWPVDVTFPGEGEPDVIDRWIAGHAAPFYQRPPGLPAPRPATS